MANEQVNGGLGLFAGEGGHGGRKYGVPAAGCRLLRGWVRTVRTSYDRDCGMRAAIPFCRSDPWPECSTRPRPGCTDRLHKESVSPLPYFTRWVPDMMLPQYY